MLFSIMIIPILFSCGTTQQKATSYNERGITYGKIGQYDQTISDFNKAIEINPRFAEAYNNRGFGLSS